MIKYWEMHISPNSQRIERRTWGTFGLVECASTNCNTNMAERLMTPESCDIHIVNGKLAVQACQPTIEQYLIQRNRWFDRKYRPETAIPFSKKFFRRKM
ncbi:hypothetical protein AB6A40_003211 [Gnathostoma spinigerum]|uniref:Uncharacterized protein n=1 Tax=Gnathostoma spinigerum TaxID=75299 RepID=A0ABD6EIK0_9BILA